MVALCQHGEAADVTSGLCCGILLVRGGWFGLTTSHVIESYVTKAALEGSGKCCPYCFYVMGG